MATLTDARDNVTAYSYDGHDRLSRTTYPAAAPHGATYEELFYESVGGGQFNSPLVASVRNRAGELIHFGYDALGQLVSKDVPNVRAYEVDVGYGYDNIGRLTSTADSLGHQQSFEYDVLGNLLAEHSNWYGSVRSHYDAAGRRWKLIWPDGFFVTYEHLVTGETAAIREYGGPLLASFGYDRLGRRTGLNRGNGTSTAYGYDPASRLAALTQELAGAGGDLALGLGYNPASQIVAENRSNELYAWKGNGNGTVTSTVNPLNQVESHGGAALAYDAKGNLTFDGSRSFAYTAENRLASGPGTNLYYDPLGRLVHLSGRGSNFHYDGADIIQEILPGGGMRRYVHGPGSDEPLVQYDGWGTRNWLHADERGSIVALSDAAGNVTAVNRYDEYGVPAQTNAGLFQYTGQVWLGELGVYSYKARMYQPSLGSFLQPDPIGYGDGMNMYAYVGGDPVNKVDPSGMCEIVAGSDEGCDIFITGKRLKNNAPEPTPGGMRMRFALGSFGGDGGGGGGGGASESTQPDIVVTAISKKQCSSVRLKRPSTAMMTEATNRALSSVSGGGKAAPLTSEFARLASLPNLRGGGWRAADSSHSQAAYEHELGDTGKVVKIYLKDSYFGGANTVTITDPTESAGHYLSWPLFMVGLPVNARNAAVYLNLLEC